MEYSDATADGNRIKYYSKGDLVTTLTTGRDGKAVVKNFPLGQLL